jgi:hypothetical protein
MLSTDAFNKSVMKNAVEAPPNRTSFRVASQELLESYFDACQNDIILLILPAWLYHLSAFISRAASMQAKACGYLKRARLAARSRCFFLAEITKPQDFCGEKGIVADNFL